MKKVGDFEKVFNILLILNLVILVVTLFPVVPLLIMFLISIDNTNRIKGFKYYPKKLKFKINVFVSVLLTNVFLSGLFFFYNKYIFFKQGFYRPEYNFLVIALLIATFLLGLSFSVAKITTKNTLRQNFSKVDKMDGIEFEYFVSELLREEGFKSVSVSKTGADFGADVIASKEGKKYAVQCKRYKDKVGIKAVQEILGGLHYYESDIGMVVTNSFFTSAAKELAEKSNVILWDRNDLKAKLLENWQNLISDILYT